MADQTFAVHCGFFDAINSDRTYSADEMNRPYKRVISNGVFATPNGTPSTDLQVTASSGMNIICKKGEGLFGDKWFENPSGIAITVPSNTGTVPRIDSVLVQVDTRTSGRVGNIVHRTGTPASSPVPPAINQVEGVVEYRLANIRVNAGVSAITQSMITDRRGSSDCPWVTSLIYQVDTSTLYDQWQAAYAEYFEEEKAIWDAWYAQLTEDLDVSMTLDRHTNTVTTTPQTTGYIPIGLDYNRNTDILEVYINGLRAVEGTHYVVVDDTKILVENQFQIGQEVTFVVMRSVISGSATNIMVLLQELESQIAGISGGTPTVVDAKADMTEHGKIYILSSDSKWYYYSATQEDWVIGGTYGGVPTDTTLTQQGMAADAKAVGDALALKADSSDVDALDTRMTAVEGDIADLKEDLNAVESSITSDPYPAQVSILNYGSSPIIVDASVTVHDGKILNSSGAQASSSGSMWYEFGVTEGESYDITGRLSTYAVVLWENTTVAKIYLISDIISEIDASGIGTYNSASKSYANWNLFIPDYDATDFPHHVNKIGITAASYSYTGTNTTPVCKKNVIKTKLIKSQDIVNDLNNVTEKVCFNNVLNPDKIVENEYKSADGVSHANSGLSRSDYIPVKAGDVVFATLDGQANVRMQYITAYNANKVAVQASGQASKDYYVVPNSISYLIISFSNDIYSRGDYAININNRIPFEEYQERVYPIGVRDNEIASTTLAINPLIVLPDYIAELLRYRPMQKPDKGYFCLVSDDGDIGLCAYSIPMCIEKQIPLTMAVMRTSLVFTDENSETYIQTMLDAIEDNGFEVAQHGGSKWTDINPYYLSAFFDAEDAFFDSIGMEQKSAVAPAHYLSPYAQALAGGRYGVVRSGYSGYYPDGTTGYLHNYFDYHSSGEGSNLFGLTSYNIASGDMTRHTNAIDYAMSNNKVLIYYYHENSLDSTKKAQIEDVIDYAKTAGMEFVTLSQLAHLNDGTID